jgi:hypothetical protein
MNITLDFDSSVGNAPKEWVTAIETAASILDSEIGNNINVTIDVGYGEFAGSAIPSGALAVGSPSDGDNLTYSQLVQAMVGHETPADAAFLDSLPNADPSGGSTYFLSIAQEKTLGLVNPSSNEIDGYVGFGTASSINWNYGTTAVAGEYSLVDTAIHELTHALGRVMQPGQITEMDLMAHNDSTGNIDVSNTDNRYLSLNGGSTALNFFNNSSDPSDFLDGNSVDALNATGVPGTYVGWSVNDAEVMGGLGYNVDVPYSAANGNFLIQDQTTGTSVWSAGVGLNPSTGLSSELATNISDVLAIYSVVPNTFISVGSALNGSVPSACAISVANGGGNNALQSSSPDTFFTGGSGKDTFYYDAVGATQASWSTVSNFHSGDSFVLWGVTPQDFTFKWVNDTSGSQGFTGLTGVCQSDSQPSTAFTLAGVSSAALNGAVTASFGSNNGTSYLLIHAT